jgi:hypothetical protein
MLTRKRIMRELELLDWGGHVELPFIDMQWLASQLYVRLNATNSEVCEACGHVRPLVVTTRLGPICAECIEDMNDNVDQIREVLDTE